MKNKQTAENPSGKTTLQEAKNLAEKNKQEQTEHLLGLDKPTPENPLIITKAKITNTDCLKVEYTRNGDAGTIDRKQPVHGDLKNAFEGLVKHMAIIYDTKEFKKPAAIFEECSFLNLKVLRVTAIAVKDEGVVITGRREVGTNGYNLTGILIKWDTEENGYDYSGLLKKAVDACIAEVVQYLGGKYSESNQTVAELDETTDTED